MRRSRHSAPRSSPHCRLACAQWPRGAMPPGLLHLAGGGATCRTLILGRRPRPHRDDGWVGDRGAGPLGSERPRHLALLRPIAEMDACLVGLIRDVHRATRPAQALNVAWRQAPRIQCRRKSSSITSPPVTRLESDGMASPLTRRLTTLSTSGEVCVVVYVLHFLRVYSLGRFSARLMRSRRPPDCHQLPDVIRGMIERQENLPQVGLSVAMRDRCLEGDGRIANQRSERVTVALIGTNGFVPRVRFEGGQVAWANSRPATTVAG